MKSILITGLSLLLSLSTFGQVSGDITKDGRKLIEEGSYVLEGSKSGTLVFKISVDAEGIISSASIVDKESTVKSTPTKIKARNYIVSSFKFEPGTWFPKYHQGFLTLSIQKESN